VIDGLFCCLKYHNVIIHYMFLYNVYLYIVLERGYEIFRVEL